ncbi:MAG: DUF4091 domain-containing protein [Verrucomicrobia bacterium]|nr:DUF4091 domain-containing protein [Verrucomicrobiota bacterium]
MNTTFLRCILSAIVLLVATNSDAAWQVWTCRDTIHVLRDERAGKAKNAVLAAARNEWESFQILLRSDAPAKGVDVEPGDLKGPRDAIIRATDAVLYRQHQLELTLPSHRNDNFKPGWYPDPLIPFRHPLTKQPLAADARFKAVPFDLSANETHGFWVDILVPQDAKPGKYRGTYRVTADGREAAKIAVELTVWDFELPRVSTLQTALGSPAERMRGYYAKRAKAGKEPEPKDWDAVEAQVADEVSRHRINATPPAGLLTPQKQADGSYLFTAEQVDALRKFVDTYHVNAIHTPHPRTAVKDPDAERDKLHAWLKSFDRMAAELNRPFVTFFTYLKDEPNDEEEYHYVQKWGPPVRAAKSVVKVMVVEQTKTQNEKWGNLYGAVDIWCPLFPLHDEDTAAQRRALGETIWTYTALCQRDPTPWWEIDFPLLNYRAPSWIAWRYHMRSLLYWGGMSYWSGVEDPWTDPKTLDRRKNGKGPLYQGEGTLVYPGRAAGYDGIAPSLRLKGLRDSIEDYEYLAILERAGLRAEAEKIVMPLAESWFKWEKDAAAYGKAREKLAALIVKAKRK